MLTKKDFVYIPPSDKIIAMDGDRIILVDRSKYTGKNRSIDAFLESLAKSKGKRAIAIIISGTGSDGLQGSRNIKEAGGFVIVQSLDSCEQSSMPKSIISEKLADYVLDPWDIPPVLIGLVSHILADEDQISDLAVLL